MPQIETPKFDRQADLRAGAPPCTLSGRLTREIPAEKNDQIVEEYVMLDPRDIMKQVVP